MKNELAAKKDAIRVESVITGDVWDLKSPSVEASDQVLGRFSDVAMIAADWFWEMDTELRFTYQSNRFEEITGIPAAQVIGRTREEAFAGLIDDNSKWNQVVAALLERKDYAMVWALKRPDGETRILRTRGRPVIDQGGKFQGYRGVGSDITEAVTARDQLLESEARFRNIVEHVTDIVCIVNFEGNIKFLNHSVENLLGYRVEDLESTKAAGNALPEDRAAIQAAMREAQQNPDRVVSGIYRYRHKDGSIKIMQTKRQCLEHTGPEGKNDIVVHARDITDQYQAEQALRRSEERLRDFAETGADWFWEQDAEFRFTYLSGNHPGFDRMATSNLIGKTREEVLEGNNFKAEKWKRLREQLEANEPFYNFEYAFPQLDGTDIVVRISGKPRFDTEGGFIGYRGTGIDITESHRLSEQLNYQASHDPLTNLVNRREFEIRLGRVVKSCIEDQSEHALCYIDLDQFKVVNDTCGHDAGDELLRQIAALLKDKVRKRDTIARLGGDEFGLLMERCSLQQANRVAESVRETIAGFRFMWAGRNFRLGASIGVIPIDFSSGNISNVMRSADAACYAAKDAGRNRIHVYSEDNLEVAQRHQEMQRIVEINQAFDEDRFVLYEQSIKPLNADHEAGYFCEALVRMVDEAGFLVAPGSFLPTAERYNLATQLDAWVVKACLAWLARTTQVRCSINLSGTSIADDEFLRIVLQLIEENNVDATRICFEITETAAIQNMSKANYFIAQLRERGCYFALDDFGSGLSSFAYLKTLPVDFLKIDGFFVSEMLDDRINFELVKSINDIGHVMGMRTIAEFVENDATLEVLRDIGVDFAQGYGIDKPKPLGP
jgi:diguanylate cyclase (GGDEF)-like protein/PAS domain S-box-containing protein